MTLIRCKRCGRDYDSELVSCPYCGSPTPDEPAELEESASSVDTSFLDMDLIRDEMQKQSKAANTENIAKVKVPSEKKEQKTITSFWDFIPLSKGLLDKVLLYCLIGFVVLFIVTGVILAVRVSRYGLPAKDNTPSKETTTVADETSGEEITSESTSAIFDTPTPGASDTSEQTTEIAPEVTTQAPETTTANEATTTVAPETTSEVTSETEAVTSDSETTTEAISDTTTEAEETTSEAEATSETENTTAELPETTEAAIEETTVETSDLIEATDEVTSEPDATIEPTETTVAEVM